MDTTLSNSSDSDQTVQAVRLLMEQVVEWQNRPLDAVYPIVYLDCIVLKVRQDSRVINKSVFLALGINIEGQ
ncbi:transposase, partial [Escherichia coli]